ncbi:hypothetical protein LOZ51_003913 [Ophidiomyces ophidiicola]|nr:hypothetical protein LOZ51_003913 [Ophidiomyces ophidiicola]
MVSLTRGTIQKCGGVLIDDKTVVTAKHCVSQSQAAELRAHAGTLFFFAGEPGLVSEIAKIIHHSSETVDLAVLHLKTAFPKRKDDSIEIDHAELPAQGSTPAISTTGHVAG